MTEWKKIKCTKCKHHKRCRAKSIGKGSKKCLENQGYRLNVPEKKPKIDITHQFLHTLSKLGGKKK